MKVTMLDAVVLTRLDCDHAGGVALLPPALPVFVQRREWEAEVPRPGPVRGAPG